MGSPVEYFLSITVSASRVKRVGFLADSRGSIYLWVEDTRLVKQPKKLWETRRIFLIDQWLSFQNHDMAGGKIKIYI